MMTDAVRSQGTFRSQDRGFLYKFKIGLAVFSVFSLIFVAFMMLLRWSAAS
ncbi:MAG: hypothetical protein ACLS6O_05855 [Bifidobacterium sp.]